MDGRVGPARKDEHLRIRPAARVVTAVADDDERPLLQASELEVPQALGDAVVQRRAASCSDGGERGCQLFRIVREGLADERQRGVVVEIHSKQLVIRTARLEERGQCGHERRSLRAHALAAIHDHTKRDRSGAVMENGDRLETSVLVHAEIVLCETGDVTTAAVCHRHRNRHQLGADADDALEQYEEGAEDRNHGHLRRAAGRASRGAGTRLLPNGLVRGLAERHQAERRGDRREAEQRDQRQNTGRTSATASSGPQSAGSSPGLQSAGRRTTRSSGESSEWPPRRVLPAVQGSQQ